MFARKAFPAALGVLTWVALAVTGFAALQRYATTAGRARAPQRAAAEIVARFRAPGRPLLIMAIHPLCPCTDASLGELADLLARSHGACDALIFEYRPVHPPDDWPAPTEALQLGGQRVPVIADREGNFATTLGAETSGHVVFVDARGTIRFHGGITIARSHRGRAPAQDAILAMLQGGRPTLETAPVFGCPLLAECNPADCKTDSSP